MPTHKECMSLCDGGMMMRSGDLRDNPSNSSFHTLWVLCVASGSLSERFPPGRRLRGLCFATDKPTVNQLHLRMFDRGDG